MAVHSAQASVGTTATKIVDSTADNNLPGFSALIHNKGTVSIFVGDSGVTTATGYEIGAGEAAAFGLYAGDDVYAISGTAAQRVDVFRSGVS